MVAFAKLEWNAVWCCERLDASYIKTKLRRKTAKHIGQDLKALFSRVSDSSLRSRIEPLAVEFLAIVDDRNGLLHGRPGTTPNGDQRLFRHGAEWTIGAVETFSDRCVRATRPRNALLYAEFEEPHAVSLIPR